MGVWGVAILSDDIAEDISFRYKDLLDDNFTNEEATKVVIEEYLDEIDDEEITAFWLSFALIQWKLGRLQDEVKIEALHIIDSGVDLDRWEEDPKLKKKREVILYKLKEKLNSPQPQAKKVPKRFIAETNLKTGDAISYQLPSGDFMILKVIEIIEQWTKDRYPLFEICDWIGKEIPSKDQIDLLDFRTEMQADGELLFDKVAVYPAGKRDDPAKRIKVIAENVSIKLEAGTPYTLLTWKDLDEYLTWNRYIE
ncbi:MAG: hypothetical protein ABS939_12745 [Psychrobacillus sp.]